MDWSQIDQYPLVHTAFGPTYLAHALPNPSSSTVEQSCGMGMRIFNMLCEVSPRMGSIFRPAVYVSCCGIY